MTDTGTPAPIAVKVTRWRCPHCARSHSTRARCTDHIGRCWQNPGARGCKTCAHYNPERPADVDYPGAFEYCAINANDLDGHPACPACHGEGWADTPSGGQRKCGPHLTDQHIGDGSEVKPGPIVGCPQWTPNTSTEE